MRPRAARFFLPPPSSPHQCQRRACLPRSRRSGTAAASSTPGPGTTLGGESIDWPAPPPPPPPPFANHAPRNVHVRRHVNVAAALAVARRSRRRHHVGLGVTSPPMNPSLCFSSGQAGPPPNPHTPSPPQRRRARPRPPARPACTSRRAAGREERRDLSSSIRDLSSSSPSPLSSSSPTSKTAVLSLVGTWVRQTRPASPHAAAQSSPGECSAALLFFLLSSFSFPPPPLSPSPAPHPGRPEDSHHRPPLPRQPPPPTAALPADPWLH